MNSLHSITLWLTVTVVLIAALVDVRTQRIPNRLVLPFLVSGLVVSTIARGWSGLGESLLGAVTAALTLGLFYYLGAMGMGDLKLCAAIGAWVGPSQLLAVLVFTGLAGAVMAICLSVARGFLGQSLQGVTSLVSGFARKGLRPHDTLVLTNPLAHRMPYAPAIAVGTICSFLGGR